jgi:hypothetical protein
VPQDGPVPVVKRRRATGPPSLARARSPLRVPLSDEPRFLSVDGPDRRRPRPAGSWLLVHAGEERSAEPAPVDPLPSPYGATERRQIDAIYRQHSQSVPLSTGHREGTPNQPCGTDGRCRDLRCRSSPRAGGVPGVDRLVGRPSRPLSPSTPMRARHRDRLVYRSSEWYDELLRITDSPVARLNRAVAVVRPTARGRPDRSRGLGRRSRDS